MSTATDMLAKYLKAEGDILAGQSVKWGDRVLTRANLAEIRDGRQDWERRVASEQRRAAGQYGPRYLLARFDQ